MKYKKIKSLEQYTQYCDEIEKLLFNDPEKHEDHIELLEVLICDYDNRTIELVGHKEDMSPVELLQCLIEEREISKAELARQLNVSKQLVTEIFNYKRNISKNMVMKLAERFKMMPVAFSRAYALKKDNSKMAIV